MVNSTSVVRSLICGTLLAMDRSGAVKDRWKLDRGGWARRLVAKALPFVGRFKTDLVQKTSGIRHLFSQTGERKWLAGVNFRAAIRG